jgi:hypothetical protein
MSAFYTVSFHTGFAGWMKVEREEKANQHTDEVLLNK